MKMRKNMRTRTVRKKTKKCELLFKYFYKKIVESNCGDGYIVSDQRILKAKLSIRL